MSDTTKRSRRIDAIARAGFAARALVYFLVGWFSVQAAVTGGRPSSSKVAMAGVADTPVGRVLMLIAAAGLAIYALWRFAEAILDPEDHGHDAHGIARRAAYAVSGSAHVALAYYAFRFALPSGDHVSPTGQVDAWSGWLVRNPAGLAVLVVIGLALLAGAALQARRAWTCSFLDDLADDLPARASVRWVGRIGYLARAAVFAITAWFFMHAAWEREGNEAGGMQQAFVRLQHAPHGPWLLGAVAAGFCLFALYCIAQACFRELRIAREL